MAKSISIAKHPGLKAAQGSQALRVNPSPAPDFEVARTIPHLRAICTKMRKS
jgi:hypothetical protein